MLDDTVTKANARQFVANLCQFVVHRSNTYGDAEIYQSRLVVVKANSQSNGKCQISTPCGSETPERILMKLRAYNQVTG